MLTPDLRGALVGEEEQGAGLDRPHDASRRPAGGGGAARPALLKVRSQAKFTLSRGRFFASLRMTQIEELRMTPAIARPTPRCRRRPSCPGSGPVGVG